MIRIKSSPSVATVAAESTSGRRLYVVIKGTNAAKSRSTSASIAIIERKYDRIGFAMRKLTQILDVDANSLRF